MNRRTSGVMKGVLAVSLAVATATAATKVAAQSPAPGSHRNILTINPLGIPFEYFSAEFERALSGASSLGLTGSYINIEDVTYSTIEGKYRFYPNEEGPKGFSIGLAAGITRVSEDDDFEANESESLPTLGVIVDYNWLLGKTKRFVVGAGLGAKRIFGDDDNFGDASFGYPTARFQIGLRF